MSKKEIDIEKLVASNAKAIQALSDSLTADREERRKTEQRWELERIQWEKERSELYKYLGRVASAQSNLYEVQSDYYHQLALLSEKQTKIEERQTEMQSQILKILTKLSDDDSRK